MNRILANNSCHCEEAKGRRGNPARLSFLFAIIVIIALIFPLPASAGVWKSLKTNKNAIEASKPGVSKTYSCFYNQLQTNLKFKFFNHTIINNTTKTTCPSGYYCLDPAIDQPISGSATKIQTPSGHAECVKADDVLSTSLCKDENTKTMIAEIPGLGSGKIDFYVHVPCPKETPFCFGGECIKNLPNCIDSDSDKGAKLWEIGKETELMLKWKNGEADGKLGSSIVKAGNITVGTVKTNDRCKGGMLMEEACRADGTPIEIGIDCKTALPDKDNPAKGAKCNDKDKDGNLQPAYCDTTGVKLADKDGDGVPDVFDFITFAKTYYHRKVYSAQQTSDGNYIILGSAKFNEILWVFKLDPDGDIIWEKVYTPGLEAETYYNFVYDSFFQQTSDGGYIIATTFVPSVKTISQDIWILKLDPDGKPLWQKVIGGPHIEVATAIQQTEDGGYIVLGGYTDIEDMYAPINMWILKFDPSGNIIWQKTYGEKNYVWNPSIQQTSDKGYIVACTISNEKDDNPDALVFKLDQNGEVLWEKTFGGYSINSAIFIQQTPDGGYILLHSAVPFDGGKIDRGVSKLDQNGNLIWQKTYVGNDNDWANSIQRTKDGNYILAGYTYSVNPLNADAWVLKLGPSGNILWQKAYGGSSHDYATSIQSTDDGGYIVSGITDPPLLVENAWVLKLDPDGNIDGCPDGFIKDTNVSVSDTNVSPMTTSTIPDSTSEQPEKETPPLATSSEIKSTVNSQCSGGD